MSNSETTANKMCEDCKKLVNAKRYTPPHGNLVRSDFREVKSMFGNVDETDYKCKVCGKEWMYESGNYGMGWVQ